MTTTRAAVPARTHRVPRVLVGVASGVAAVGSGHLVAALLEPAASPVLAVGSVLIDAAPTPVKELAVRTLGTNDKPVLIAGVAVVLVIISAVLGLLTDRQPRRALVGIAGLGAIGALAAAYRLGPVAMLPSIVSAAIGVAALATAAGIGSGLFPIRSPQRSSVPGDPSRRRLLIFVGALTAGGVVAGAVGTIVEQTGLATRRLLRLPSPISAAPPIPGGAQLPGMTPFVTAPQDFYRVDISLVTPRIAVEGWTLTIDGLVDRPLTLSYDDLLQLPMIERDITLTCVSNEVGGPYVSTGRWLGVPFSELIKRIGVQPGVEQVFSYSMDSGYTCSTPYQAVSDGRDAMIVVGMNGAVLPDERGFPARMLVPGLFGFVSATKWLRRIEFTTYAKRTAYWTQRKWATDAPILTQSRIDVPVSLGTISASRPVLAGVAWAQHRGIAKVEIKIDDGMWEPVDLAVDAGVDLWRQWSFRYDGPPGRHSAQVRATDATGATQPERRTRVFPSGATGWHQIQFSVE